MGVDIDIRNVTKSFGSANQNLALGPIDISLKDGEFVSVLGPSGCGKSTLMLLVAGLVPSSSCQIDVSGNRVNKPLTEVGIAFQDHLLLDFRTVEDNVLLQAEIRHLDKESARRRTTELLTQLGVEKDRKKYPSQLSGGMKQRVAIARALLHSPPLLLMDEPFGALDAITRTQAQRDLEDVWMGTRATVMFITHSIEEAVRLSDRVLVMSKSPGEVVEDLRIDMPRPRSLVTVHDPVFRQHVEHLYALFEQLGILSGRREAPSESLPIEERQQERK